MFLVPVFWLAVFPRPVFSSVVAIVLWMRQHQCCHRFVVVVGPSPVVSCEWVHIACLHVAMGHCVQSQCFICILCVFGTKERRNSFPTIVRSTYLNLKWPHVQQILANCNDFQDLQQCQQAATVSTIFNYLNDLQQCWFATMTAKCVVDICNNFNKLQQCGTLAVLRNNVLIFVSWALLHHRFSIHRWARRCHWGQGMISQHSFVNFTCLATSVLFWYLHSKHANVTSFNTGCALTQRERETDCTFLKHTKDFPTAFLWKEKDNFEREWEIERERRPIPNAIKHGSVSTQNARTRRESERSDTFWEPKMIFSKTEFPTHLRDGWIPRPQPCTSPTHMKRHTGFPLLHRQKRKTRTSTHKNWHMGFSIFAKKDAENTAHSQHTHKKWHTGVCWKRENTAHPKRCFDLLEADGSRTMRQIRTKIASVVGWIEIMSDLEVKKSARPFFGVVARVWTNCGRRFLSWLSTMRSFDPLSCRVVLEAIQLGLRPLRLC